MYSLGELAAHLGLRFSGDSSTPLSGLAALQHAGPQDVSFLADERHRRYLASTNAGAVILRPDAARDCPGAFLESPDPALSMAQASSLFVPARSHAPGCHPSAVVSAHAHVSADASIGAQAVIEAGAVVEAGVILEAGVYVGADSSIGEGSHLHPQVVVYHGVRLGRGCTVHSHTVLGADGFGYTRGAQGWQKQHQLGGVDIGDDVEIGACTTIDRGTFSDTVIGDGVIIDNQVQVAHNCRIGDHTAIAGCVGIAGSTTIGANCTLAGGVGVVGHLEICDDVHVTCMTMVTHSIEEPGSYSGGTPMSPTGAWRRSAVRFSQLESMQRRLVALERGDTADRSGD